MYQCVDSGFDEYKYDNGKAIPTSSTTLATTAAAVFFYFPTATMNRRKCASAKIHINRRTMFFSLYLVTFFLYFCVYPKRTHLLRGFIEQSVQSTHIY